MTGLAKECVAWPMKPTAWLWRIRGEIQTVVRLRRSAGQRVKALPGVVRSGVVRSGVVGRGVGGPGMAGPGMVGM